MKYIFTSLVVLIILSLQGCATAGTTGPGSTQTKVIREKGQDIIQYVDRVVTQDKEVVKYYKEKQNGFFVEIGASDGIKYSNTLLLEKKYNWKGICVEPIPINFQLLCKNRPKSICCDKAVYNTTDMDVVFDIANYDLLSGISSNIDCHKIEVDKKKTQINVY